MEGNFIYLGKNSSLKLLDDGLHWTHKSKGKNSSLTFEDILCFKLGKNIKHKGIKFKQDADSKSFTVYHIKKGDKRGIMHGYTWTVSCHIFTSSEDDGTAAQWVEKCNQRLTDLCSDRPKRLLVLINPASGHFKGQEIYEKHVVPIFELVSVQADVVVLERRGHAGDLVQEYNLQQVDGVVTVSGDGTFADCINGLLLRAAKEANVNVDDNKARHVQTSTRCGVLPAGTANQMAYMFYRTRDTATAALNIVIGTHFLGDALSNHCGDKYVYSGVLSASSGMFSDMLVKRENARASGKKGFSNIPATLKVFKPFFSPKPFRAEIHVLKENGDENRPGDWEVIHHDDATEIMSWLGDMGTYRWFWGRATIMIMKPCSVLASLKLMSQFMKLKIDAEALPHLTIRKTEVYKIVLPDLEEYLKKRRLESGSEGAVGGDNHYPDIPGSVITVDGEIFPMQHHVVTVRVHRNTVRLFGKNEHPEFPMSG